MMKRLAAIAAMSLVAFQAVSGVAMGVTEHLGSGTAPLVIGAGNDCPAAPVLGVVNVSVDQDVTFQIDSKNDTLDCDNKHYDLDDVESVIFYGNNKNDNQQVNVTFDLQDANADDTEGQLADFGGIEFTIRTDGNIEIKGSGVDDDRDDFEVMLEDDAFSVDEADLDVAITYADTYEVTGGAGDDTIDGRKVAAVDIESLDGGDGKDVLYGGSGDDSLACAESGTAAADQCWGGDGDDEIDADAKDIVAPGDGDDEVNGNVGAVTYADSSAKVAITVGECGTDPETESDAGDDDFDMVGVWYGSAKSDTFVGSNPDDAVTTCTGYAGKDVFFGQGGNDRAFGLGGNDTLRGGAGNDVLKGGSGSDKLRGDSGSDEAWGGKGKDACGAEVTDNCEFLKG